MIYYTYTIYYIHSKKWKTMIPLQFFVLTPPAAFVELALGAAIAPSDASKSYSWRWCNPESAMHAMHCHAPCLNGSWLEHLQITLNQSNTSLPNKKGFLECYIDWIWPKNTRLALIYFEFSWIFCVCSWKNPIVFGWIFYQVSNFPRLVDSPGSDRAAMA